MHYEGNVIRPPSEAYSILLQATVGCSHNKCTFCGAYKGERFKIKPDSTIMGDIEFASNQFKHQKRLFICDGDALIIPQKRLLKILTEIQKKLPWVQRVGAYANTKSIKMKTDEELAELKNHGLGILYMGLETGHGPTLKAINKGASAHTMVAMGRKAKKAGFKLSITVLIGIAGRKDSTIHAVETGKVLSAINPDYVGALSLMLIPGTPLFDDFESGEFPILDPMETLKELRVMLENTNLTNGLFHANHASNYLPVRAHLPQEKVATLRLIDEAIAGNIAIKPEHLRAL